MKWAFGNWKMAQSRAHQQKFLSDWNFSQSNVEVGIFPSFVSLSAALTEVKSRSLAISVGAQDCSTERSGAFTGEVSAESIRELGCSYVLIGHSERRQRVPESAESLKSKLDRAFEAGLVPVFCVGESERERDQGLTTLVVMKQLEALKGISSKCLLAYEPVWAIGTGRIPSTEEVQSVHEIIWKALPDLKAVLYGGSVKAENAKSLASVPGVSGFLVGGASLDAQNFKKIAEALV